jgi:hypothetical protein
LKRLLDEFPYIIDYDGLIEYQRALGLLTNSKEIEAIEPKLSILVTHRFDSILLLLGELPQALSREVSSAKYLMGYDCYVYPTYEAAPKFQAYCLQRKFPRHLEFFMLKDTAKKNLEIPKKGFKKINKLTQRVINEDEKYYYVEEEDLKYSRFESFGNHSVELLFEAELLRVANKHDSAWQKLKLAEAKVIQSGSIEHLCLLHLMKTKLYLDKGEFANSAYEIFEGLELANKAGYKVLQIDLLNEQARFYLDTNDQTNFLKTIKSTLELSTSKSCKYFWGALLAASLLMEATHIYSKKEEERLREILSVFKEIFETQNHESKLFKKIQFLMGYSKNP